MKVTLANYDSNRIRKRVGFSWLYFFFGPFYLIARLHFEGILLAVIYYYLLPIPGMNYIAGWIGSWGISSQAAETVSQILLFFRSGWNHIEVYLGLILFLFIHLMMSYIGGSCVLRRTIKRKKLAPVTEDDARQLIKWHCVKADVLLSDIPERFLAQQGHNDVVEEVPAPFEWLATSERCRWQGLKHPSKPFYGLQFHPELGRDDFMLRMKKYAHEYADTPERFKEIDEQVKETTVQAIIKNFVDRIVVPHREAKGR